MNTVKTNFVMFMFQTYWCHYGLILGFGLHKYIVVRDSSNINTNSSCIDLYIIS